MFLAPHFDDVALSCGGTVAAVRRAGGSAAIIVVFGGTPGAVLTEFAAATHANWGIADRDVIARRRAEDLAAAAVLGASTTTLPFLDAIYRGDRYLDDDQLFGRVHPDECGDTPAIVEAVVEAAGSPTRWWVPAAIGGHVDHRHVHLVGRVLAAGGHDVWCYEDQPYALDRASLRARAGELDADGWVRDRAVDVGDTWNDKIDAIVAYRSQLASVFRLVIDGPVDRASIDRVMRAAATDDRGRLVERHWRSGGASVARLHRP